MSYTNLQVAEAIGIPVRRLEGWVEAGVLEPTLSAGKQRRWSDEDALRAALVAEVQKIFGTNLRPGTAARILNDPLTLPLVDAAMRLAIVGRPKLLYVAAGPDGRVRIGGKHPESSPVVLVLDPGAAWTRISRSLRRRRR